MSYDLRRLLIFFLILVLPAFVFKEYHVLKSARQPQHVVVNEPKPAGPKIDHHFVVVYISNGANAFVEKSLHSICNQDYRHYRVIYVQNGNDAKTQKRVEDCLFGKKFGQRLEILSYATPVSVAKIYKEILQDCKDEEIIVQLSHHDWLSNYDVLKTLNETYQDDDVWLAYGSRLEYPSMKKADALHGRPLLNQQRLMKMPWSQASVKSFYARLLKQVDLDVLAVEFAGDDGVDYNFMVPMLKLAKWHVRYVPQAMSVHNRLNVSGGQPPLVLGKMMDQFSQNLQTCAHLAKGQQVDANRKADLIIMSHNQPYRLDVCLESIFRYVSGLESVYVIYTTDQEHQNLYLQLQEKYAQVCFRLGQNAFKTVVLGILKNQTSSSEFVAVATDNQLVQKKIQLGECIQAITQTEADVFYLSMESQGLLAKRNYSHSVPDRIHIMQPDQGTMAVPLNLVLYRKEELLHNLDKIDFNSPSTLIHAWQQGIGLPQMGLYYEQSKAVQLN